MSAEGSVDDNGQLHGDGVAYFSTHHFQLKGQWLHGMPYGQVCVSAQPALASADGQCLETMELVTELPSASDYGQSPARIAPGYLWPQPSADYDGRRVVTIRVGEGVRTYEVSASRASADHAITLRCVDQDEGRVAGGKLPPKIAGGVLEDLAYTGNDVYIVQHLASKDAHCVVYLGKVSGCRGSPFQRAGKGRTYMTHRGRRAVLTGHWWQDAFQPGAGKDASTGFPLRDCDDQQVLIEKATECSCCLGVYSRGHPDHRCAMRNASPRVEPKRHAAPASQPSSHHALKPTVHILGFDGRTVSGFVRQNMEFADCRHLGGGGGAFAYVALDVTGNDGSRCYARRCRETLASRARPWCPHLHALQETSTHIAAGRATIPPGHSLDGFMLLLGGDIAEIPARACLAEGCVGESGEGSASVAEAGIGQGRDDTGGGGSDEESEPSDDNDDGSSVATYPMLDRYVPPLREILCMPSQEIATLARLHNLPLGLGRVLMRHQLVEHFHPTEVGHLSSYYNEAVPSTRQRSKRRALSRGEAAKSAAAFRVAHRIRRCVDGNMCREFATQKMKASTRLEALEAAHAAAQECSPCEGEEGEDDDDDVSHSIASTADGTDTVEPPGSTPPNTSTADFIEKCLKKSCDVSPCRVENDRCVACGTRVRRTNPDRITRSPATTATIPTAGEKPTTTADLTPTPPRHLSSEGALDTAPPAEGDLRGGRAFDLPVLALPPAVIDDFVYAITLACARRASPVIALASDLYAVLRSEHGEGGYRSPGGYSMVSMKLQQLGSSDPSDEGGNREQTLLHMHCTCSEYHNCRSGLGGRSKASGQRTCTCCLMVIAAKALASPNDRLLNSGSLWLLASQVPVSDMLAWTSLLAEAGKGIKQPTAATRPASDSTPSVNALLDGPKLPEHWEPAERLKWKAAGADLHALAKADGVAAALTRRLEAVFPCTLRPLPVAAPTCPCCVTAGGQPRPLLHHKREDTYAWVFVAELILRQAREVWTCSAPTHTEMELKYEPSARGWVSRARRDEHGPEILTMGTAWTRATALFDNGGAWFFSVLLLDDVTALVKGGMPGTSACQHVLTKSFDNMADLGAADGSLPTEKVAVEKMWDAWYTYELGLKEVPYALYCKCLKCGWLPAKTGSDACAKVAMNLAHTEAASQVDYSPAPEGTPLWSQERLLRECLRWSVAKCVRGSTDAGAPIPVDLVPPMFYSQNYAAAEPCNTERRKRAARATLAVPKASLLPCALAVADGTFNPFTLRDGSEDQGRELDILLDRLHCPKSQQSKMNSHAQKRKWLLSVWDSLGAGDSHCHMFVSVRRGTGGTVSLCCPHGVVLVYKFLFSQESNRDHDDLLRSLLLEPAVHWMDDSCGLMAFRQGLSVDDFKALYGSFRGCPREWHADPDTSVLLPVEIPELADEHIRRKSIYDPDIKAAASAIRAAKGKMRTARHPFLRGKHQWRLCLTDRLHQSIKKKTHKRTSCQQHLACIVKTLAHDRTAIMESLNARLSQRLKTLCTLSPKRAIPFYHRITYWENRKIIEAQRREFRAALAPGQKVIEPEPFGIALYVCEHCELPVGRGAGGCECKGK